MPHGRKFEAVEDSVTRLGTVPNHACAGAERVVRRCIVHAGVQGLILVERGLAYRLFGAVVDTCDSQLRRALSEAVAQAQDLAKLPRYLRGQARVAKRAEWIIVQAGSEHLAGMATSGQMLTSSSTSGTADRYATAGPDCAELGCGFRASGTQMVHTRGTQESLPLLTCAIIHLTTR